MTLAGYYREPLIHEEAPPSSLIDKLERIWATEPGAIGWLSTVDHKEIGIRYLVTAFAFLVLGGIEALIFRVQLAQPEQHLLTPEQYDQLFTMHGITMIFLYASPILSGFSNYLWPLLLGARDMALPRLNAFSYWVYLLSGLFIYASFLIGAAPNDGWFNYVPYASRSFNPGPNMDFYALGLIFLGLSTTVGAINFMVTMFRMRAPGMSINRVPIMVWGTLTASAGNLLAVPAVSLAFFLLWLDRQFGTHFFNEPERGPSAALAASLLDVRPSLGLRHRASGNGHRLRRAAGILPQAARRLHGRRALQCADHDPRLRRLATPHVRNRPAQHSRFRSSAPPRWSSQSRAA